MVVVVRCAALRIRLFGKINVDAPIRPTLEIHGMEPRVTLKNALEIVHTDTNSGGKPTVTLLAALETHNTCQSKINANVLTEEFTMKTNEDVRFAALIIMNLRNQMVT